MKQAVGITAASNDVAPAFVGYLRPLIGGDLPDPAQLRPSSNRAAKMLGK
jgi:hypothetical protein